MNNTDVEAPNPGCEPRLGCKLVPQIRLVDWNVIPETCCNLQCFIAIC